MTQSRLCNFGRCRVLSLCRGMMRFSDHLVLGGVCTVSLWSPCVIWKALSGCSFISSLTLLWTSGFLFYCTGVICDCQYLFRFTVILGALSYFLSSSGLALYFPDPVLELTKESWFLCCRMVFRSRDLTRCACCWGVTASGPSVGRAALYA